MIRFTGDGYVAGLTATKRKQVVVVGAGPAGCVAALSAARNGADVLLVERWGYLGGMMTGGGIGGIGINGYRVEHAAAKPIVVKGIALEILQRLQEMGGALPGEPASRHVIDSVMMTHLLDQMMEEAGVEVLFNTVVFDTVIDEGRAVKGVAIANKSGGQVVLAGVIVDASADADVAAAGGVPFLFGRPEDGRHHGGSMDMQIGGVDVDRLIEYLRSQPPLGEEERTELEARRSRLLGGGRAPDTYKTLSGEVAVRELTVPAVDWEEVDRLRRDGRVPRLRLAMGGGGPVPGRSSAPRKDGKYVPMPPGFDREWIEYIEAGKVPPLMGAAEVVYPPPRFGPMGVFRHGKVRDGQMMSGVYECWYDDTNEEEVSRSLIYRRKLNWVYLQFLRERIPGFEDAHIVVESPTGGSREGRRIAGEYVLTEQDVMSARTFPDVIAKGGPRGPDSHSVTGLWGDGIASPSFSEPYDIPYRCLVPKGLDNLLVAGRCISTTALAFGAIRDQATCMSLGEAAGAAASVTATTGVAPRSLDVRLVQRRLVRQGAMLFVDGEENRLQQLMSGEPFE